MYKHSLAKATFGLLCLVVINTIGFLYGGDGKDDPSLMVTGAHFVDTAASVFGDLMLNTGKKTYGGILRAVGSGSDVLVHGVVCDPMVDKTDKDTFSFAQIVAGALRTLSQLSLIEGDDEVVADEVVEEDASYYKKFLAATALRLFSLGSSFLADEKRAELQEMKRRPYEKTTETSKTWGRWRLASIWSRAVADFMVGSKLSSLGSVVAAGVDSYEALHVIDPDWFKKLVAEKKENLKEKARQTFSENVGLFNDSDEKGEVLVEEKGVAIVDEDDEKECSICCAEELSSANMVACSRCHKKICSSCLKRLSRLDEYQDDSPTPTMHPGVIEYRQDLSQDEYDEVIAYESATPESNPELRWYYIHGHKYFLMEDKLWRYADKKNHAVPDHWRCISLPECPYCRNPFSSEIENYAI